MPDLRAHLIGPRAAAAAGRVAYRAGVVLICVFLVAPSLVVVAASWSPSEYLTFPPPSISFRWYAAVWESPEWRLAGRQSLVAGLLTSLVATAVGTMAARALVRSERRLGAFLQGYLLLPMVVPIILVALGVFFIYARIGLNNTMAGLVLAHSLVALPFVVVTVRAGLLDMDPLQERAAASLGASPVRVFFTITLPQNRASLGTAAVLAFLASLDETVVSNFIATGDAQTLPRKMFSSLRNDVDPKIAAISSMLIVVTILGVTLARFLRRRSARSTRKAEA